MGGSQASTSKVAEIAWVDEVEPGNHIATSSAIRRADTRCPEYADSYAGAPSTTTAVG